MRKCQDCGVGYSEHCFHTGYEKWCEDCFDKGLSKDMNDHFKNAMKEEMKDFKFDTSTYVKIHPIKKATK